MTKIGKLLESIYGNMAEGKKAKAAKKLAKKKAKVNCGPDQEAQISKKTGKAVCVDKCDPGMRWDKNMNKGKGMCRPDCSDTQKWVAKGPTKGRCVKLKGKELKQRKLARKKARMKK